MRSFFQELQRRNVYKIGAMYVVGGWLVVQIATQVLPIFNVSALAQRVIVLLIIAGFPVALVLSWIYELTPDGIARTANVAPDRSITHHTGQKLNWIISGILGLAVVFLLAQRYWLPSRATDVPAATSDKSIAVLPFENLSDEKANGYFADGIQDEILTRLAKIGALKVISRTSTQHYASSPDNLPEIAKQLGVANILEGSVQRAGDAVHINVQLIHAASDTHLWAEVYNRKLDDIFAVEADVAGAIANALSAKLTGAEHAAVTKKPTDNLAAYDAYLRGRALTVTGYGYANTRKVIAAYAQAVQLDPKFALAWANLAEVTAYLYFNNVDTNKYTPQYIKQAMDTAFQLQPELSEAQLAQGIYRYRIQRDFAGAQTVFEGMLKQSPNNVAALQYLGLVERRQGQWELALAHLEQAAALDPRNAGLLTTIGGETLANMHRYDEARVWLDRALAIAPNDTLEIGYKAATYQYQGRLEDAASVLDSVPQLNLDPTLAYWRAYQRLLEHHFTAVIDELQPVLAQPETSLNGYAPQLRLYLALAQQTAGQPAQAQATYEHLIAQIEPMAKQRDDSLLPVSLGVAYAHAGRKQAALDQAQQAVQLYADDGIDRPLAELGLAEVQMVTGDHDAAIATLAKSLTVPVGITPAVLRLDPTWDPLRGDPRFAVLTKTTTGDVKASGSH
ncbi:MAG: tetratricopeptide repeat protein [Rudaea sp.]